MLTRRYLVISAIGLVLLVGAGLYVNHLLAFPTLMNEKAVEDGTKVTVWFQITPSENPTMTYSDIEQFVQGQHVVPYVIEQQVAGMQPGESKTFPLSAEEGFGPYDATKTQTIPTADLPVDAREGDRVDDEAGRSAKIMRIAPDTTVLDLNHPLAGQPIMVTLMVMTIEMPEGVDKNTMPSNRDPLDVVIVDPMDRFNIHGT
jgi:FKBP-type peptidyl-prolyl cis-trans isomerase 2